MTPGYTKVHDSTMQFGRELWDVQLGRRDGVVSRASEALSEIPSPSDNFTALEANFGGKGLDVTWELRKLAEMD